MKEPLFEVPQYPFVESWRFRVPAYLKDEKWRRVASLIWLGLLFIASAFVVLVGIMATRGIFASPINISRLLHQGLFSALAALGILVVFANGGLDLSIGAMSVLSGLICATLTLSGMPIPAAILIALIASALIGAFHGFLSVALRLPGILITLISAFILRGIATLSLGGRTIPVAIGGAGVSAFAWVLFIIGAALAVLLLQFPGLLAKKKNGPEAEGFLARLVMTGLPYAISACFAAIAGIFMVARLGAISPLAGSDLELSALFIVILGGASFGAGSGNPLGAVLGAILLAMINNLMSMMGINPFAQRIVLGLITLFAIVLRWVHDLIVSYLHRERNSSTHLA